MIRPYYHIPWFRAQLANVNETINPATARNDPYSIKERASSFGGRIILLIHSAS